MWVKFPRPSDKEMRMCNGYTKEEIHEQYKKKLCGILFDFYVEASKRKPMEETTLDIENGLDLMQFIKEFVEQRIKPAREDWSPG